MVRAFLPIVLAFLLVGCATTTTEPARDAAQREKEAAKINVELGLSYLREGEVATAKQRLLTAMEQAPEDPLVWSAMGYYLEAIGETEDAETHYRKALQLAPNSGKMLNNYGTFLCRQGKYSAAINQFQTALRDSNYLNKAELYENAGICASYIPDYEQAERYFLLALERDPKRTKALFELAEVYAKQNKTQQAYKYIKRYLHSEMQPSADSLDLAIQLAKQAGTPKEAESYRYLKERLYP